MMKDIIAFKMLGMYTIITQAALFGSLALIVALTICALYLTDLSASGAVAAAILATIVHWIGEWLHQYGHFMAARRSGYPSSGVRLWAIIGTTLYPSREGDLPAQIHIRRALGGALMSSVISVVCIVLAALLWSNAGIMRFVLGYAVFSNLVLYTIGALLPPIKIGRFSNDGATILYWLRNNKVSE